MILKFHMIPIFLTILRGPILLCLSMSIVILPTILQLLSTLPIWKCLVVMILFQLSVFMIVKDVITILKYKLHQRIIATATITTNNHENNEGGILKWISMISIDDLLQKITWAIHGFIGSTIGMSVLYSIPILDGNDRLEIIKHFLPSFILDHVAHDDDDDDTTSDESTLEDTEKREHDNAKRFWLSPGGWYTWYFPNKTSTTTSSSTSGTEDQEPTNITSLLPKEWQRKWTDFDEEYNSILHSYKVLENFYNTRIKTTSTDYNEEVERVVVLENNCIHVNFDNHEDDFEWEGDGGGGGGRDASSIASVVVVEGDEEEERGGQQQEEITSNLKRVKATRIMPQSIPSSKSQQQCQSQHSSLQTPNKHPKNPNEEFIHSITQITKKILTQQFLYPVTTTTTTSSQTTPNIASLLNILQKYEQNLQTIGTTSFLALLYQLKTNSRSRNIMKTILCSVLMTFWIGLSVGAFGTLEVKRQLVLLGERLMSSYEEEEELEEEEEEEIEEETDASAGYNDEHIIVTESTTTTSRTTTRSSFPASFKFYLPLQSMVYNILLNRNMNQTKGRQQYTANELEIRLRWKRRCQGILALIVCYYFRQRHKRNIEFVTRFSGERRQRTISRK